jgi:energy-converting hydrogenase Eha subunit B
MHFKNEKDEASPRDESRQHIHNLVQVIFMLVIEWINFVMVEQVNNDEREDSDARASQIARK